jgi:hypothetical protein
VINAQIILMRQISKRVKDILLAEPNVCARKDEGDCQGNITWEHSIIFGGKQLDEAWAILKICEYHHAVNRFQDGGKMDKEKHIWLALNRATDDELIRISKSENYIAKRERLNAKYNS